MVRKVVGGVITAVPYVASGAGHVVSGVGSIIRGAVNVASYAGSLLPTGHDEEVDSYVRYTLSKHAAQIDQQLRREQENQQQLRLHLQDVQHQQHSIIQHDEEVDIYVSDALSEHASQIDQQLRK